MLPGGGLGFRLDKAALRILAPSCTLKPGCDAGIDAPGMLRPGGTRKPDVIGIGCTGPGMSPGAIC